MSWWDDLMSNINRPVNFAPQKVDIHSKDANPLSNPNQMGDLYEASQFDKVAGTQRGANRDSNGAIRATADITPQRRSASEFSGGVTGTFDPGTPQQMQPVAQTGGGDNDLLSMLKDALSQTQSQQYNSGPYMQGLDAARSASLKAIADARGQLQGNFDQSNDAVQGIYAKGKQDTLADNKVLQDSNANLVGGLGNITDGAVKNLQDDRTKELQDRADMEQRLGLQASGLQNVGDVQTKAIADAQSRGASEQNRAAQYGGADIAENTSRAEGLIGEGASRQAALRSQLSGLLGQLSNKELDINNQYANQSMQATNQAYQDHLQGISSLLGGIDKAQTQDIARQKLTTNSSVLAALARQGGSSGGINGMANLGNADQYISAQGQNPADYNNAYTDAMMNTQAMPGTSPTDQDILKAIMAKNPGLDPSTVLNYLDIKKNPSKYGTGNQNSSNIISLLSGVLN